MVLRLDPRVPMVWRDPFSLQFGVEPARVILREVSAGEERMIAALTVGVTRLGLSMVARSAGASEPDAARLLAALSPVLTARADAPPPPTVVIVGRGPTVDRIASALAESGIRVTVTASVGDIPCDLALVVGHYVFDPEVYGFWLRRDVPHLPILFGDGSVTIGPLVEPGGGPCLYCLEFYRRDADSRWSTLASQLWGTRSAAETPLISREVAALATRMALRRLRGETASVVGATTASSFRLDADDGQMVRREWIAHPDCGCREPLARDASDPTASAVRPGTGSAGAASIDLTPRTPRRAEAFGELA